MEILSQVIPQAKTVVAAARGAESQSLRKVNSSLKGHTVDTAVPDRLSDLVNLIDERMGKLENRSSTSKFSRQVARIETVRQDPRYAFRFDNATVGSDTMAEVVGQLFRLPANGQPMTVMQLAGFPSEVVGLGCVRARPHGARLRAVERWRGAAAVRVRAGPPLRARRQKHWLRPDPQGDFVWRTSATRTSSAQPFRTRPQACWRSCPRSAHARCSPSARAWPCRRACASASCPAHMIPRSESELSARVDSNRGVDSAFIHSVVQRWRGATMGNKRKLGEAAAEPGKPAGEWGIRDRGRAAPVGGRHPVDQCPVHRARKPAAEIATRAGDPPAVGNWRERDTGIDQPAAAGVAAFWQTRRLPWTKLRLAPAGPSSVTSRRAGVL